jgi:hypothetical protein
MTRTAPYLTLGAVAVLGGGLFLANGLAAPAPAVPLGATPVVAAAPAAPPPDAAAVPAPAGPPPAAPAAPPAAVAPAPGAGGDGDEGAEDDGGERVGGDLDYAGYTDDRDMTVAISVRGDEATAYVCGAGLEVWLSGSVSADGRLDLTSSSGRSTLTGTGGSGRFTSDGTERGYTAEAVDADEAVAGGRDDVGEVVERAEAPDTGPVRAPEPEASSSTYGGY